MTINCQSHYLVFLSSPCKRFESYSLPMKAFNSSPPPDTSYSNMAQLASEINGINKDLIFTFLLTLPCDSSSNSASVVTSWISRISPNVNQTNVSISLLILKVTEPSMCHAVLPYRTCRCYLLCVQY